MPRRAVHAPLPPSRQWAPFEKKLGRDVAVGDVIASWLKPQDGGRTARVTRIEPHRTPLAHLWNGEARLAHLVGCRVDGCDPVTSRDMVLDPGGLYDVLVDPAKAA